MNQIQEKQLGDFIKKILSSPEKAKNFWASLDTKQYEEMIKLFKEKNKLTPNDKYKWVIELLEKLKLKLKEVDKKYE